MLPSALLNDVGTPNTNISQLNTWPAGAPVNASMAASRLATHDSGSGWFAGPSLHDSFIHYSTPVYPGALNKLLASLIRRVGCDSGRGRPPACPTIHSTASHTIFLFHDPRTVAVARLFWDSGDTDALGAKAWNENLRTP